MNLRRLAWRAPLLAVLALLLARLALSSSLLHLLQTPIPAWWIVAGLFLALLPALVASGSPLSATLAVVVPAVLASSYGASHLEWLKTLKEFHLAEGAPVAADRLLVAGLALALAWGLHVLDAGLRLAQDAAERGILPVEQLAARRVVWARGARAGGIALGVALALGLLALVASAVLPAFLPAQGVSFVAPVGAAALLGVAALLVLGVRKRDAPRSADDGD